MNKYKVGDKVKVHNWDWIKTHYCDVIENPDGSPYEHNGPITDHKKNVSDYYGKVATILVAWSDGTYILDGINYVWDEYMFEDVLEISEVVKDTSKVVLNDDRSYNQQINTAKTSDYILLRNYNLLEMN